MRVKKICKKCRLFYEGEKCPLCGSDMTASSAMGRVFVFDVKNSDIAKIAGIEQKGEYAIKVR